MRTRGLGWAGFVMMWAALAPSVGRAQGSLDTAIGYAPPDVEVASPLYSLPAEDGPFFYGGYALYRQTNTLEDQLVAVRGFVDVDGFITAQPGRFVGLRNEALNTNQVRGPGTYQPGFFIGGGYRFRDGSALTVDFLHLVKAQYTAVATLASPFDQITPDLSSSYLFSPVFNFPVEFSGPPNDVATFTSGAFGIWNAADLMTLEFVQRNELFEITYRQPIYEDANFRTYGLVGPRFVWFWERFKWRTNDLDVNGVGLPIDEAIYTNIVSNRMYGAKIGCGSECYLGHGFSVSADLQASALLNVVKERVKYERGDRNVGPERKRSRTEYTAVPELRGTFNLWWYPYEGIQMKIGYDVMMFFNTVAAEKPIDFDYSGIDPEFNRTFRVLDGLQVGIAFIF